MRFDHLERLVGEGGAVDRNLAPHLPGWMTERVLHGGGRQSLRAPATKGAARRREDDAAHGRRRMPGDALKDRAVLAVHRNDFARSGRANLPHQISRDDERLLVGERDTLSFFERGERCVQASGTNDRIQHDVHIIAGSGCDQGISPALPGTVGVGLGFHHSDEGGRKLARLLPEKRGVAVGGESSDAESLPLTVQYPQRGRTDRARRAKHRHPFGRGGRRHWGTGSSRRPSSRNATGITNNRLSKRSRIPPCPGMMRELSFTPASRLSSDSARSPVWAATLITIANRTAPWIVRPSCAYGMRMKRT